MPLSDQQLINLAREWALDCQWEEDSNYIEEMPGAAIKASMDRHYDGGWKGFVDECLWEAR